MIQIRNYKKLDNAFNDYIRGSSYKEISFKYGVSINTVKSWVRRYNWAKRKSNLVPKVAIKVADNAGQKIILKLELEIKNNKVINARIK